MHLSLSASLWHFYTFIVPPICITFFTVPAHLLFSILLNQHAWCLVLGVLLYVIHYYSRLFFLFLVSLFVHIQLVESINCAALTLILRSAYPPTLVRYFFFAYFFAQPSHCYWLPFVAFSAGEFLSYFFLAFVCPPKISMWVIKQLVYEQHLRKFNEFHIYWPHWSLIGGTQILYLIKITLSICLKFWGEGSMVEKWRKLCTYFLTSSSVEFITGMRRKGFFF